MPSRDRGRYGREHRALRRRLAREVQAGLAVCWRCGRAVPPGSAWHLGHDDSGTAWMGVEHAACNTSAGGQARAGQLYGRPSGGRQAAPDPNALGDTWSRHWYGPFDTRCPACRELGRACENARAA